MIAHSTSFAAYDGVGGGEDDSQGFYLNGMKR